MKKVILITGGARSGKSRYAEELALSLSKTPVDRLHHPVVYQLFL